MTGEVVPVTERVDTVDVIVVGSGAAGLTTAITARDLGQRVMVVTRGAAGWGTTLYAMGGLAAVLPDGGAGSGGGVGDSVEAHLADTLAAGGGVTDPVAAAEILRAGPKAVSALTRWGMPWDRDIDRGWRPALTREGGHSAARILHTQDATGRYLIATLHAEADRVRDGGGSRIEIREGHTVVTLITARAGGVVGVLMLDPEGRWCVVLGAVVLATGGLGQIYAATTNPPGAVGHGLALGLRAGAVAADIEFVQFHPTGLHTPGAVGQVPLVTEAVRGEPAQRPATLVDSTGARVMTEDVHALGDLAPRDVVASAIAARMASLGDTHVLLDATGLDPLAWPSRFPTVLSMCRAIGIHPAVTPIPVAPAAHYACGGIESTVDGRTGVRGLYVAGEVARTGLHGANRLASNSLLEAVVMGLAVPGAIIADRDRGCCRARSGTTCRSRSLRSPTRGWSGR
ncbi:hypothetical protein GCM10029964_093320 [Kibdelosporangium lantanae]